MTLVLLLLVILVMVVLMTNPFRVPIFGTIVSPLVEKFLDWREKQKRVNAPPVAGALGTTGSAYRPEPLMLPMKRIQTTAPDVNDVVQTIEPGVTTERCPTCGRESPLTVVFYRGVLAAGHACGHVR